VNRLDSAHGHVVVAEHERPDPRVFAQHRRRGLLAFSVFPVARLYGDNPYARCAHRVLATRRSLLRVAVGGNAFNDADLVARLELSCQILSYQCGTSAVVRADKRYGNAGGILEQARQFFCSPRRSIMLAYKECPTAQFLCNVRSKAALIGRNIRSQGEFRDLVRTSILWAK
jgi:hypothetical protein